MAQWRKGSREGLKIPWAEGSVWVRIPPGLQEKIRKQTATFFKD